MKTEQERRRELEMMTEAEVNEVYALAKGYGSANEFVGHRTSGIKGEMIDYIVADEKSKEEISD